MTGGRYDPGSRRPPGDSEAWDEAAKTVILDMLATHHAMTASEMGVPVVSAQEATLGGSDSGRAVPRRVNGFMHLPALRKALNAHVAGTVTAPCDDEDVAA